MAGAVDGRVHRARPRAAVAGREHVGGPRTAAASGLWQVKHSVRACFRHGQLPGRTVAVALEPMTAPANALQQRGRATLAGARRHLFAAAGGLRQRRRPKGPDPATPAAATTQYIAVGAWQAGCETIGHMSRPSPKSVPPRAASPGPFPTMPGRMCPTRADRRGLGMAGGLILVVAGLLVWLLSYVSLLIIPVMVAALLVRAVSAPWSGSWEGQVPKGLAVAITILGFLGLIVGALSLVGRQLVHGLRRAVGPGAQGLGAGPDLAVRGPAAADRRPDQQVHRRKALQQLQNNSSASSAGP